MTNRCTNPYWIPLIRARRLSTSSEWSLIWNGEGGRRHFWCHTGPFAPSWTMVALYMAQHQTSSTTKGQHDKWTTSITLDCDRHYELSAPAVSSLSIEAKEAPLQEIRLNLLMHYYMKTGASIDNLAHHALHEYDTRDLYAPKPNGRGGMTRPATPSTVLKVEAAVTCAEINVELVCPLRTPSFPPETLGYDPWDTTSLKE